MGDLHRFTVDDYHRMGEAGILGEDSRVELIRGRIVDMAAIDSAHMVAVNRLTRFLVAAVGDRAVVSVQNPVRLDDRSEPQPDIALLRPGADDIGAPIPQGSDVLLLIEVADSSLYDDRNEKAELYAAGGVPEYWIVNLVDQVFEVFRRARGGAYQDVSRAGPGTELEIGLLPGVRVAIADLLGA